MFLYISLLSAQTTSPIHTERIHNGYNYNFQCGHAENNIGYPRDVVWRIGRFSKIRQYFQYLKQNDRLRKLTQPVKEAGFYVFDDDPVKEDHSLFFKFLSYPPQLLNQSRLWIFQHPRFPHFLWLFRGLVFYPNALCAQHDKQDQYLQESGVRQ